MRAIALALIALASLASVVKARVAAWCQAPSRRVPAFLA
jgi:hypothetical protein